MLNIFRSIVEEGLPLARPLQTGSETHNSKISSFTGGDPSSLWGLFAITGAIYPPKE